MTSSTLRFDHLQHQFEENPRRHFVPLANAFLHAGNARRAVELCRTFLPQLPGHVSGHVVLAEALRSLGATDEARAEYERVLALDAENLVAARALGDLAATRGNAMEARGWYARLVELDPRDAAAAARLDELTRAAAEPVAPPYDAVAGEDLDERQQAIEAEAAPFGAADQELAEEFTAGFFASVLHETPGAQRAEDDARFASDLDHLLPGETLPGADELHATLSMSPQPGAPGSDPGPRSLTSVSPFDLDDTPYALGPFAFDAPAASHEPTPPATADAHSDTSDTPTDATDPFRATPVGTPIMEEFPEDAAAAADLSAEPGPAFVTETMAELYLRQGFRSEALDVYRQLLAASPHDERLQARVAELARPAAPTPETPLPVVPADAGPAVGFDDAEFAMPEPEAALEIVEQRDDEPTDVVVEPVAAWADAEPPEVAHAAGTSVDDDAVAPPIDAGSPREESASTFALGSGGMVEGVAGVEDRSWALADPTPPAPTVGTWLSRLVAGEELSTGLDAAHEPQAAIDELAAPAPVVEVSESMPATDERDEEPALLAAPAAVEQEEEAEPMASAAPVAWEPPTEPADLETDDVAEAHDEPAVAWVEAEPEEFAVDVPADLELFASDEPMAASAGTEPQPALPQPDDVGAAAGEAEIGSGWPTWAADALLPAPESEPATGATSDDPFAWDEHEPGETPAVAASAAEPFSLDDLFALPASPADETAADTLAASTAGLGDDDTSRRLEANAAGDASSLGALLRATPPGAPASGEPPAAPAHEPSARGGSFSFEQFFRPTPAAGGHVAPPPARPAPEPAAERDDDLDEFHRWLEGLSKS